MTFLNLYILIVLIIYLSAFFIQNLKTYFSVKQSIRGRSVKLTISLVLSTGIYVLTFGQLASPALTEKILLIGALEIQTLDAAGSVLITLALIIGLAALYEMKNSWRVGIKYDQKTALVTTGIYSISRNPYFLSYDLLFAGIFLIFPTVIILVLIIGVAVTFHLMILEEERYLSAVQGEEYEFYRKKTGRYLFGI
jgi:protein-S-isoprenylcysteine O-methyltransferase Ste14